jgi:hypothetical protein
MSLIHTLIRTLVAADQYSGKLADGVMELTTRYFSTPSISTELTTLKTLDVGSYSSPLLRFTKERNNEVLPDPVAPRT